MNDFTEEELIKLKNGLEYLPSIAILSSKYLKECNYIIKKIESMIDNYCEHAWENPCCGCSDSACYCTKCNRKIYDNQ